MRNTITMTQRLSPRQYLALDPRTRHALPETMKPVRAADAISALGGRRVTQNESAMQVIRELRAERDAFRAERDALKAECERLRAQKGKTRPTLPGQLVMLSIVLSACYIASLALIK